MTDKDIEALAESVAQKVICSTKDVLTFDEALRYTGMKKGCLYKLTMARKIPHSKPNGKMIYFRRADLDDWLMSGPVATETELNTRVQTYCMKNPLKITHK